MDRVVVSKLILVVGCLLLTGCPSTKIVRHPGLNDKGVRFYRPKPHLLIKPTTAKEDSNKVDISLEYLPDYSEEYSVHIRSGIGINETNVTLTNGWNLTGLNVKLDSQTDENIKAIGEAAKNIGGLADRSQGKVATVTATNVPLGYYEAVTGYDDCGVKQMYGWRYIGFMPFNQCPTEGCGGPESQSCYNQIWGLIWEDGMMKFKILSTGEYSEGKQGIRETKAESTIVSPAAPAIPTP